MKGNAGRGKRIAAITAAILTFTGVATVNPYMVYAQDAAKSITITGNTTEILKGSSDAKNQQNHWSMQIDNETGKDILFYDLKEDNKEITKKQAFKGDTLVLDLENYDGNSVYTVEVYGVDKNIKASAKLYQVQANLTGDTSTNVPMANGVVSEAEKSRTYEASESCVVNDVDYDLNGNGNVSVGYDDNKSSSGYSVDYVKHDSTKNSNIYKAGVQLTDDSGNVLSSENITYYGTYTYQAPKTFSQTSTDENGKSIVNYYKAVDEKAQAVLKKEDNGKSIKIAYQKVDSQTAYDWNINLIDLMTGKTLKTVTQQIGVDESQTYDVASTIENDGVTYTLDSSMQSSYKHTYGDKSRTTNIYYYNKEKWIPENGYDITVKYVNIADRSQITTQTITVTNEEDAVIDCPAEYQNNGHTYIRLKGQSDTKGATYALYKVLSGEGRDILIGTQISDENGYMTFENVEPGTYYFKEVSAPAGHTVDEYATKKFTVSADGTINQLTAKRSSRSTQAVMFSLDSLTAEDAQISALEADDNKDAIVLAEAPGVSDEVTKLSVSKLDYTNHEFVTGAKMQILEKSSGKIVAEWTTGDSAESFERKLNVDTSYILREVSAPEGYDLAEDTEFIIDAYGILSIISGPDAEKTSDTALRIYDKKLGVTKVTKNTKENHNQKFVDVVKTVKTGDTAQIGLFAILSIAAIVVVIIVLRRRKNL